MYNTGKGLTSPARLYVGRGVLCIHSFIDERVRPIMTTDTTCDRQALIAERRASYEADVIRALLEESSAEHEERLELVRIAQEMVVRAFQLEAESAER